MSAMQDDFDKSRDRLLRGEEFKTHALGFGFTKQGQALVRRYQHQLANSIGADRSLTRDKTVWRALKGTNNENLALRLLIAGISVCHSETLGADRKSGKKNFRDQALWIGRNLGIDARQRKLALKVGTWGVNMLLSLPLFELDGDILTIPLTESLDEFLNEIVLSAVENNGLLSPLFKSPTPWTQIRKGGLPSDHWARVSLIREHHPSIENAVRDAIGKNKMRRVLDAINYLQGMAFTINTSVLDFMNRAGPDPKLSATEGRAWAFDLSTARAMACSDRFFVPLNFDFRGRIYAIPHFNFLRQDHVRALFLFADGEPIDEDGLKWLKAHIAGRADGNAWSTVKKPSNLNFDSRLAWTDENRDLLCKIGNAVLAGDDPAKWTWTFPDDPYQFIAACVELAQAINIGRSFVTRLPLTFDASCSGLQHLCAMTRADEGRRVNLTKSDGDQPNDFYSLIAFALWDGLRESPELQALLDDPFDRKIVKQPAMSYFYGARPGGFAKGRPFGMTKQVADVLKERGNSPRGAKQLAHMIYRVIENAVPGAAAVRGDFLEVLAQLCANHSKSLRWETPLGFPIINCYHRPDKKHFAVSLNGRRRDVNLIVGDTDKIARKDAQDAVTANFVHSIDACHLQLVALAAAKEGIPMVSVHDCFGTTAPRAKRLNDILRKQFARLHKRHNQLNVAREWARQNLPKTVKLPDLPKMGTLDVDQIAQSFFAFS